MNDWLVALHNRLRAGRPCVRVVVANVIGSAPREIGASMLVDAEAIDGSIGGGHLEWKAIEIAREMLLPDSVPQTSIQSSQSASTTRIERLLLGAMLGQCCGGAVELWLERYDATATDIIANALAQRGRNLLLLTTPATTSASAPDRYLIDRDDIAALGMTLPEHFDTLGTALLRTGNETAALLERIDPPHRQLWLFGAGHVGKALVKILADLPLRITWVDNRESLFAAPAFAQDFPSSVTTLCAEDPVAELRNAPPDAWYLVMTHDHALDYAICQAVLTRNDFAWLGLIGSQTKATHFRNRLLRHGIETGAMARMSCPVGLLSVSSKLPAAIAISVAAQLLTLFEQQHSACKDGLQEHDVAANGAMQAHSLQRSHLPGSYA